jgi:hypothetical protein
VTSVITGLERKRNHDRLIEANRSNMLTVSCTGAISCSLPLTTERETPQSVAALANSLPHCEEIRGVPSDGSGPASDGSDEASKYRSVTDGIE